MQILDYYYSTLKPKNYSEIELNEELQENNFTKKYIDYLFEKANVKYEENARTIAQELFDSNPENVNLDEISSELRLRKFTAEQITYAISNIDWNKYLTTQTTNFILYENGKVDEVYFMLSEKGFPDDITYDFINSYDWDGLASKCLEQYMQSNKKKTPTEINNYLYDFRFSKDVVEHALESVDYNSLAEQLAKDYINKNIASDISPFKIKFYLQDEGFNGEQIDKAINSIDFYQYAYQHATDFASSTLKEQGSISRPAVQDNLSRFENYSTSVIEKVISNMDWKHYAYQTTLYFKNCNESKGRIIQLLENYGYTSSEITYATEKIDWKVHCKTILEVDGLNKTNAQEKLERLGFDQSEIEYAIKTTNWNQKALAYAKDLESTLNIITKRDVEGYLENDGYSSSEIKYAINGLNINWNEQAYSFLLYELERSPGISFDNIRVLLQDENFTSAEINYAFNKYSSEHPAE